MSWGQFFATQLRQWGFTLLAFGFLLELVYLVVGLDMPLDLSHVLERLGALLWSVGAVSMLISAALGYLNGSDKRGTND